MLYFLWLEGDLYQKEFEVRAIEPFGSKGKDLLVIGGGGFSREVIWLINRINAQKVEQEWNVLGIIDDKSNLEGTVINNVPFIGNDDLLLTYDTDVYVALSINNPRIRELVVNKYKSNKHIKFATLVDPSVIVGPSVNMGEGCIICANTIITVDATIDDFCIVNLACTICYDAHLKSYTTLYPSVNVSGFVQIESGAEIGTGAQILQDVIIGTESIIGPGSVVFRDIPPHCTATGIPAKPIIFHGDPS
jgi:sugar O-acyltransferase (sialic acid O-acetyltransferase NeuD family)